MDHLMKEVRQCKVCKDFLPCPPRPIVQASKQSRILIIGQAPGQKVNDTGIPWNDPSGNELRRWLGVDNEQFYNSEVFALVPMGFCYPGKGKSGDMPPRPECAPLWHPQLLTYMQDVKLTILIGQYAQKRYLGDLFKPSLTDNVKNYHEFLPDYFPVVHPSPRNKIWQKKNPWFEVEVVPKLQEIVSTIL